MPMPTTQCEIHPLSPERLDDYLAFFDHAAFADNPRWARCYCRCYYFPHHQAKWSDTTAEENRAAVIPMIRERRMQGYLAYADGKVVGWCNAAPRPLLVAFDDEPVDDAEQIGSFVCFIVAKPYRGQGIATRLLHAALDGLRVQGLKFAEAYPRRDTQDEAPNYKGPLSMYLAAGFEVVRELDDGLTEVRKEL